MSRITKDKMVTVLSINRSAVEQKNIEEACRNEIALRSNDRLQFIPVFPGSKIPGAGKGNQGNRLIDLIYYEIEDESDIKRLISLRETEPSALLALLTYPHISPVLYLRPQIAPLQLLLRPVLPDRLAKANAELFDNYYSERADRASRNCFILKSRDGRQLIPYDKISYFEAYNKKINVRVGACEYDFYGSLDAVRIQAPDYFVQCHRAYLVNSRKIFKIHLAENRIALRSGENVPLSRTYRKVICELTVE